VTTVLHIQRQLSHRNYECNLEWPVLSCHIVMTVTYFYDCMLANKFIK